MTEEQEFRTAKVTIHLRPYDSPDAQDYHANLTAVATTQDEVILVFGRMLPTATPPDSGEMEFPPQLRVTVPVRIARNFHAQLGQQLQARDKVDQEISSQE